MDASRNWKHIPGHVPALAACIAAVAMATLITGCGTGIGGGSTNGSAASPVLRLSGIVHGGQQPVSGSTVQLYTVGTSGIKSASTPLLNTTVMTNSGGGFSITGDYSCTGATPGTQIYLTATGGDPSPGTVNNNLTMVAALGSCSTILANAATTFIDMNELTTVAAAYAFAPFAQDITHIGATGSNPTGLVNAFSNAALLANIATGTAGGSGLAAGVTVPTTELNTIANIIAACVNTGGATSSACSALFGATGATDTFGAALGMAKNPGASLITSLLSITTASPPFLPMYSTQPADFTVAVTFAGNGTLSTPYALAIDAAGDAWVTNESGSTITEFSPTGSVLATPAPSNLYGPQGIAIDRTGNIWVANTAGNSVMKFSSTGVLSNSYTAGGITGPTAIAMDSAGDAWIANFNGGSVTELSSAGAALHGSPLSGNSKITSPTGIALDASGNVYVTSGTNATSVVKLSNAGAYVSTLSDSTIQGPAALAIDSSSHILTTGFTTGTAVAGALMEIATTGTVAAVSPIGTAFSNPSGVATDGASFWVANSSASGGLSQWSYGVSTATSAASGFGSLNAPVGVAVDNSGAVWTANSGSNTLSKFIGLAVPVTTPLAANAGP